VITTRDIFALVFGLVLGALIVIIMLGTFILSITTSNYTLDNDSLIINLNLLSLYSSLLIAFSIFFVGVMYYLKQENYIGK
jgi:hypothetical protein